jgi:23S rRNA (cytosine1962-C5)-methyltransferase
MQLLTPQNFSDYELIDSGNFEKLERWGTYITARPEPQAIWDKRLSQQEWNKMMHVKFVAKSSSSGVWSQVKQMPDRWNISYALGESGQFSKGKGQEARGKEQGAIDNSGHTERSRSTAITPTSGVGGLSFRLALTSFKHVGLFPEQSVNWDFIYNSIKSMKTPQPKVLNLFAYTGASSLAAKAAGADVTHLDSIKQVVTWARENMEHSNLDNIRWVVEDAVTYVKRELKRGKKYNGIILDPPAFGHGPNGESWKLEDEINNMLKMVAQLLNEEEKFVVLNTYSLGLSSLIIENMMHDTFKTKSPAATGEIYLQSRTQQKLPLGVFGRFCEVS